MWVKTHIPIGKWGRLTNIGMVCWWLSLWSGCTKVDVDAILRYRNDKLALEGNFCTTIPSDVFYATRVLFVIDCNDLMRLIDPNGDRGKDALEVIKKVSAEAKDKELLVEFGVLRFGSTVAIERDSFEEYDGNDNSILVKALEPIWTEGAPNRFLGGTNYVLALEEAVTFISKDQALNQQSEYATSYVVVFISDGSFQAIGFDPQETIDAIYDQADILNQLGAALFFLRMPSSVGIPPEFIPVPTQMAQKTQGGRLIELASPDSIDGALSGDNGLLRLKKILRFYKLRELVVVNHNALLTRNGDEQDFFPDSDGDGLADFQEGTESLNTSPYLADTDGDYLSDLVELKVNSDPTLQEVYDPEWFEDIDQDGTVDNLEDDDGDGLNNYEERRLGTEPYHFDSDMDRVPDGVELRFNTNPLINDGKGDYDDDFIPNIDEIRAGTNPYVLDDLEASKLRYVYQTAETGRNWGAYCYWFRVDNITLRPSASFPGSPRGLNRLQVIVIDSPEDKPEAMENQRQTSVEIIYRPPAFRDPNALELILEDSDFH